MSFILDALKKSEAERLRRDTPGFAAMPDGAREKPATHWYWIVAVLVVVNVGVLAFIYTQPERAGDVAAGTRPAGPDPGQAAMGGESVIVSTAAPAVAQPPVRESAPPAPVTVAPPQYKSAPGREEAPAVAESYATFNELRAQGALQLPDMHLDIHVYSDKADERFVFVNMRKYKERSTMDAGPVVREITPDGVVLDYRGTRFLLPRE